MNQLSLLAPREESRGASVVRIPRDDARDIIEAGHYLGHMRKVGMCYGLFLDDKLSGAAVFGQPSREGVARWLGGTEETVTELVRFYTLDAAGSYGTWFLSRAVRALPQQYEVVVAYSDPTAGHHGGLYQAASWIYLGPMSGTSYHYEDAEGNRISKQTPWRYATRAGLLEGERAVDGENRVAAERGWRRVIDPPKYRYAFPRNRKARRRLGAGLPYPKPDRGSLSPP